MAGRIRKCNYSKHRRSELAAGTLRRTAPSLDCKPVCYSFFSSAYDLKELLTSQTVSLLFFKKRITVNVHERVDPAFVFAVVFLLNRLFASILGQVKLVANVSICDCDVSVVFLVVRFGLAGTTFFMSVRL